MLWVNVARQEQKRVANRHFLMYWGRLAFRGWRLQPKLSMALDLWTGNKLRREWLKL